MPHWRELACRASNDRPIPASAVNNCGLGFVVVDWRSCEREWRMQGSRFGFAMPLLFAVSAIIGVPGLAVAQDMPPILAPLASSPPASPGPASVSPSATAIIPPAVTVAPAKPTGKPPVALATRRPATPHRHVVSATMKRRLASAHAPAPIHHVALRQPEPSLPPGIVVPPPPGYFAPGPRERLVYGGPPPGIYGGWGRYHGPYPY